MVRRGRHGRTRQRRRGEPLVKETMLGSALKLPLRAAVKRAHDEVAAGGRGQHRTREHGFDRRRRSHRGSSGGDRLGRRQSRLPVARRDAAPADARSFLSRSAARAGESLGDAAARPSEQEPRDADARHRHARAFARSWSRCARATGCSCAATVSTTSWRMRRSREILRSHNAPGCCRRCADRRGAGTWRPGQCQRRGGGVRRAEWRKLRAQKTILWLAIVGGACAAILLAVLWWWLYGR